MQVAYARQAGQGAGRCGCTDLVIEAGRSAGHRHLHAWEAGLGPVHGREGRANRLDGVRGQAQDAKGGIVQHKGAPDGGAVPQVDEKNVRPAGHCANGPYVQGQLEPANPGELVPLGPLCGLADDPARVLEAGQVDLRPLLFVVDTLALLIPIKAGFLLWG